MTGTHTRKLGLFRSALYGLFGEPDQSARALRKATSHGATSMALGRAFVVILMVVYSGAFILYLGSAAMGRNFALIASGHAPNWAEVVLLGVIWLMAIALDVAFNIATLEISTAGERGTSKLKVWTAYAMVGAIALIETYTFTALTAQLEHPADGASWAFLLVRSALAPAVSAYLATRRPHPPTQRDFERLIQLQTGQRIMDMIGELAGNGEASLGVLFRIFANASHYGSEQLGRVHELQQAISALDGNGGTQEQSQMLMALMHAMTTGQLPASLIEQYPELAGLQLTGMAKRAAPSKPASKADGVRGMLASLGIEPCRTPKGKRGVWLASTSLPALTSGRITIERATEEAKRLAGGGGTKSGTAYAFPFESLRQIRHMLTEPLAAYFEANEAGETPANVTSIDRARVSA